MKDHHREIRIEIASLALCTLSLLYFVLATYFATGLTAAWLLGEKIIINGVTLGGDLLMAAVGYIAMPGFILLIVGARFRWLLDDMEAMS